MIHDLRSSGSIPRDAKSFSIERLIRVSLKILALSFHGEGSNVEICIA